jgi:cytoskeletal protein RodZ
MNRNQKIAIGCGGAGCLGLIVVALAAAALYVYYEGSPLSNRNSNSSVNSNRDSNTNSSDNDSLNSNSSESSDETPSSSMSEDDKHKLFQAAGATGDNALILRVLKKIGFASGTGSDYEAFVKDHFAWAMKNVDFMTSVSTPDKARAYVEEHLDD